MGKTLIIAEKPSVARDIGKVLKCTKKGDGFLHSDKYIISWAVGHLVTLCEPEDYSKDFAKWSKNTLPIIPKQMELKAISRTRKQLVILHKLMNQNDVDDIVCATDSGREGELIFRYIYLITKCNKPFKRLWISSMTDEAIKKGFDTLKEGKEYDNLFFSAKCRSEADWLVGINATRAFTIHHNVLLSVGRVQTPTLAIIVQRHIEITNFVSKPYYELLGTFKYFENENALTYTGKWYNSKEKNNRIDSLEDANELITKLQNATGIVKSVTNTKKNTKPPLLFDLTELQRECNSKFGFSAKQTLDIAQSLYESKKVITYPRTDSRFLSSDMKKTVKPLVEKLSKNQKFEYYCSKLLDKDFSFTKRVFDDKKITDHHAIIPTGKLNNSLSLEELKVFYTVVKRFLSVFYPDYKYNSTNIKTEVLSEIFITKGQTVIDLGWRELYQDDKNKEEQVLPNVKKDDSVVLSEIVREDKKTNPPPKYNEASLLGAMENPTKFVEDEEIREQMKDGGIGTPATRASIIERLLQVGYIERKGKTLEPTEKGIKLIEICPEELKSPATTGKWEKGLNKIARGELEATRFMESINRYVHYLVNSTSTHKQVDFPEDKKRKGKKGKGNSKPKNSLGKCPFCEDGKVLEHSKGFYCSNWKNKCKFTIWKNTLSTHGVEIDNKIITEILKNNVYENFKITMPDTKENATCSLVIKEGNLKVVNVKIDSNTDKITTKKQL